VKLTKKPLLITGMKHCGKTTVGKLAADALTAGFVDIDSLIEELYRDKNGVDLTCREIYRKGSQIFQAFEMEAAEKLLTFPHHLVAAAGGGLCENEQAAAILKNRFLWIYLSEEANILYKRIISRGIPAFLPVDDAYNGFLKIYKKRSSIYENSADIKISARGRGADVLNSELIELLRENGYAG
jgi:shikimate kinase